ncbi:acyltransferase family protein [Flavobacterium sp. RSP29]|uniref:acyltransferase family protein n=1 Tax=Flavobacterium sp. RSP29 TaxID=3401731 RepID=UPI003AAF26D0
MNEINKSNNSLDILVLLRAIAVMMVCFCHFGGALSEGHNLASLFTYFHDYGKYGVHVFFVISGFVIPLSFLRGKYSFNNYPRFLIKRVLRLHPPYLAALLLTLVVMYLSYSVRQIEFPENAITVFKSFFYIHAPADNPVFWTLMIEAQYYIFIGIFYILLIQFPRLSLLLIVPLLLIISQTFVADYIGLFQFVVFFLVGTVGFLIYTKNGNYCLNYITLISLFFYIYFVNDIAAFISSFISLLLILSVKRKIPPSIQFLGLISYSIYLIHFPIGIKFINFFKTKIDPSYSWLLLIITLLIIVLFSWVFYLLFESFSEKLSKKIKYNINTI